MVRKNKMAKVNDYIPLHYVGRRTPVRVNTGTETRVEQCHQETTNINKIIARYRTSGVLPAGRQGRYEDVSQVGELLDVKMQIEEMQSMYESLPDNIKEKLPFADIGNVTDQSLEEMTNGLTQNTSGQHQEKTQLPTGANPKQPENSGTNDPSGSQEGKTSTPGESNT